jgi:heme-degrading monooxygenase HmoA
MRCGTNGRRGIWWFPYLYNLWEEQMAVTVIIKRKFGQGNEELLAELYREMRCVALKQPGFIGAETLKRVDVEGQLLVISKWQHLDDWSKWLISKERMVHQDRIDALTSSETKFEIYVHS